MNTRYGTAYFTDEQAIYRYFTRMKFNRKKIEQMISNKEVFTGKPKLKPGQKLYIIPNENRYAIIETTT